MALVDDLLGKIPGKSTSETLDSLPGFDDGKEPADPIAPGTGGKPRRGRPPGSKNGASSASRGPTKGALKDTVLGMIAATNMGIAFAGAGGDCLTPPEADALADALINDATTARWLSKTGKGATHIALFLVLVQLSIPRLVNHGIINIASGTDSASPVPMEAGGAYGDYREHRDGQNNDGGAASPSA